MGISAELLGGPQVGLIFGVDSEGHFGVDLPSVVGASSKEPGTETRNGSPKCGSEARHRNRSPTRQPFRDAQNRSAGSNASLEIGPQLHGTPKPKPDTAIQKRRPKPELERTSRNGDPKREPNTGTRSQNPKRKPERGARHGSLKQGSQLGTRNEDLNCEPKRETETASRNRKPKRRPETGTLTWGPRATT